jgi:putative ABC transport system permease protein
MGTVRLAALALRGSAHRSVLAVTAIALAVAFVVAGAMIAESARGALTSAALDAPRTVTGVVRADARLPASAVADVPGVPVVGSGAAVVDAGRQVLGTPATILVADPRVVAVVAGRLPGTDAEAALDPFLASLAGAELGGPLVLVGPDGGLAERTLVGLVRPTFGRDAVLALTGPGVQTLVGGTGWSHLLVFEGAPADQDAFALVAARLPEPMAAQLQPAAAADRGVQDVGTLAQLLLALLLVVLVASVFVIGNSFAAVGESRRRETALLRVLGVDREQVRRSAVLEGLALGLVGLVPGLLLGTGAGRLASSALRHPVWPGPGLLLVAAAAGLTVTLISGWLPARRASAVPPVAALVGAEVAAVEPAPKQRAALGVLLAGAILLVAQVPLVGSVVGGTLAFAALVLLGPWLTPWLAARLMPGRAAVARLARRNVTRSPRRTARTATALMLGVALSATGAAMSTALANLDEIDARYRVAVVAPTVPPALAAELAGVAGVDEVLGQGSSFAELGLAADADRAEVRAAVGQVLARYPGARLAGPADFGAREPLGAALGLGLAVISAMALIMAVVGVLNTVVLGVRERRRELGVLRASGMTRRQVLAMVLREAVGLTMIGIVFGLVLGAVTVYGMLGPASVILVPFISWWLVALVCLATVVSGVVAACWPAIAAARTEPAVVLAQ